MGEAGVKIREGWVRVYNIRGLKMCRFRGVD